ncbi:LCP family protein [bacterium]|nr:LCP family protein [bacterium]
MKIPYYAMIDFTSFQGIVDAIGGIDIEVPETIHDVSYP